VLAACLNVQLWQSLGQTEEPRKARSVQ